MSTHMTEFIAIVAVLAALLSAGRIFGAQLFSNEFNEKNEDTFSPFNDVSSQFHDVNHWYGSKIDPFHKDEHDTH